MVVDTVHSDFCLMNHFMLLPDGPFQKHGFGVRGTVGNDHQQQAGGVYGLDWLLSLFTG